MITLPVSATVHRAMYEHNGKRYINLRIDDETRVRITGIHNLDMYKVTTGCMNKPTDNILEVKIPWRYNRVMCTIKGDKVPQELNNGDEVDAVIKYGGPWRVGDYSGFSWQLQSI